MSTKKRFQELDSLRGIAVILVVLFHLTMKRKETNLEFNLGVTGVDLFFLISGFVIYFSLTNIKTSKEFIVNRFSRLFPTYWFCVSFTYVLILILSITSYKINHISVSQYLANMTMLQYYFKCKNIDGSYWTMLIELIFYIGILCVFYFKSIKNIKIIGTILTILVLILTIFSGYTYARNILLLIPFLEFTPLFFAGILFYKIYSEKNEKLENYFLLFMCYLSQIILFKYSVRSVGIISLKEYMLMQAIYFSLFILFVNGKLKFIISKPFLFLGKISFPLYLIHQKISNYFILPLLVNKFHINFWIASLLICLPIVICLATLITNYIEIPIGRKIKEKLSAN